MGSVLNAWRNYTATDKRITLNHSSVDVHAGKEKNSGGGSVFLWRDFWYIIVE
jgi:hypothetical protein